MGDDLNVSASLFDIKNIILSLFDGTTINWPGDKAKLKVAIAATGDWAKTLANVRWNLDDAAIDKGIELLDAFIDSAKNPPPAPVGPMIVGATSHSDDDFSVTAATSFLASFGNLCPEETRQKIMAHPHVLESLKKLSRENQIKVMNRQDLLDLLIKWGPTILSVIMTFLPFIF